LHAVGGVPKENLHVVLAIHGGATYATLNDKAYHTKYGVDNPNTKLIQALNESGVVDLFVCGQSLIGRGVDSDTLSPFVKVATSMLTTATTYQLKGYAMLKF
jgi:intracellular sulfur oxidation DsrE/DsrF family protein